MDCSYKNAKEEMNFLYTIVLPTHKDVTILENVDRAQKFNFITVTKNKKIRIVRIMRWISRTD